MIRGRFGHENEMFLLVGFKWSKGAVHTNPNSRNPQQNAQLAMKVADKSAGNVQQPRTAGGSSPPSYDFPEKKEKLQKWKKQAMHRVYPTSLINKQPLFHQTITS